ncbi:U3 small nucleolar RNA-interacting protein 2 [Anoplophora glabripennis]|uniref:U3 small nucleolar RNA-interacting protein 2 n=1 Tax=Anoplophora glabripennis TaxID=217634 RepID=UPI000874E032|nr:U3 small nucleolar RNA-interacting protein 2 [Anoplophora glabripennis]
MSFFIKGKQVNGIKRVKQSTEKRKKPKVIKNVKNDEVTSSEDEGAAENEAADLSSEDENETAQEKKLRLAKVYLEEIEKEEKARLESEEVDQSLISKRLKEDYLKEAGKLRLTVADKFKNVDTNNIKILKCREQTNSITCMCITSDDKYVFVGSKNGVVIKYSIHENKKVGSIPFVKDSSDVVGHSSQILSVAVSTDNKYLTTSDESSDIFIWDLSTLKFIKKLTGHKKGIFGLCFKKDSHTLYSCSKDRSVKVWNLDEMAYVETLFGHQGVVTSIDTLYRDRVVTSGGRDLRIWKITEETQLIFNGHVGNIDNVKLINEENFISGGDDGQLCVWSIMRKKPLCVIQNAHGVSSINQQPNWISSIAPLLNTDLVASGSNDGFVKLWKLENNFKFASPLMKIPVEGFINSLGFTSDGSKLIVAVSKEHKLGRWTTIKSVKNCIMVIPFIKD